jgi:hypothetical protein
VRGKKHYVYHSTTHYDRVLKKAVKTSEYLGKLDMQMGFIPSNGRNGVKPPEIRSVSEYGNSLLLHEAMKDLKPLLIEAFPERWQEIYALSMIRVTGNVPLKRAKCAWEKLYNADSITPNMNPQDVSNTLREVGVDRIGQDIVFKSLLDKSEQLVYDLSSMFSRSISIHQAEKGYNKDKIHVPQINLALLCSADSGLPTLIRSLPGSVKDITTLANTISDVDVRGKILILDRGFFSEDVMDFLDKSDIKFVLPTRRNSNYYKNRIHLTEDFEYHERLILCGKRKVGDHHLYLFKDRDLELAECKTLYNECRDGVITKKERDQAEKKAGKILIISNMDMKPLEIYYLFKKRERVEKMFDTYKNVLEADRLYLQDDERVFGHVFIAFLSLYAYCKLEGLLKKAEINHKVSPSDLLFSFSKVYRVDYSEHASISPIPKRVANLDRLLGLNLFPTK